MRLFLAILCLALSCATIQAQAGTTAPIGTGAGLNSSATASGPTAPATAAPNLATPQSPTSPGINLSLSTGSLDRKNLGSAIEIVLMMTLLSMAPAIVMTMTCFTRIIIVLSFLKRAMSIQELPPRLVVTGFAVFLTIFIMTPVIEDVYNDAYLPYIAEDIDFHQAADLAGGRLNRFMIGQTRPDDIELIVSLSHAQRPTTPADVPFQVAVPAFILSEIKTAFQMGFVLFLPFIAIDLVISAILISMGMFTLPPVVVSTPLKLLLFILVDGWNLVIGSLAQSFATP